MSLVNLAHVCSHLQNASKARLSLTSITLTKLHLALALALQKQGFISTVQVGGKDPPTPISDTILPQDAETLTYEDYTKVVKVFRSVDGEVLRKLPWSWHQESLANLRHGGKRGVRREPKLSANSTETNTPDVLLDQAAAKATQTTAEAAATSGSVAAAAQAAQAPSISPAQQQVQSPVELPILSEDEYNERPWLWLYRNNLPTPLSDFLASPSLFLTHPTQSLISFEQWQLMPNALPHGQQSQSAEVLALEPWRAYPDPHPFFAAEKGQLDAWATIPRNPAQRRLWLGLKYWNNEPVISKMQLVSKPTRRMKLDAKEIGKVSRGSTGRSAEGVMVNGLSKIGECLFVRTAGMGLLESRECSERGTGGMPLVRVW